MKIEGKPFRRQTVVLIFTVILFAPLPAMAGGVQHYPNGLEAEIMGVSPPPGLYYRQFNIWYSADKLKDNRGKTLRLETHGAELDKLNVYAVAPSLRWQTPWSILGGNFYSIGVAVGLKVDMKLDVATPGGPLELSERRERIYDLIWVNGLGWHRKDGLLHAQAALDTFIPVGMYDGRNFVNVGKNVWTFIPNFSVTAFSPFWDRKLEANIKLMYDFDTTNDDFVISPAIAAKIGNPALAGIRTHNSPGNAFHTDFALDYQIYEKLRVGLAGYFYQQTTDDKTGFGTVKNDKTRVFAIGPHVWVPYKKWFFGAHAAFETAARNGPQGWMINMDFSYKFF
jgi:hypothetical protein